MLYLDPSVFSCKKSYFNFQLQGTGAIPPTTEPPGQSLDPVECSDQSATCVLNGTGEPAPVGVDCNIYGDVYFTFYFPGDPGTDPGCTYMVEGQTIDDFCNNFWNYGSAGCQNGDERTNVQCRRNDYACTGSETVIVSCPGFSNTTCEANPNVI